MPVPAFRAVMPEGVESPVVTVEFFCSEALQAAADFHNWTFVHK